MGYGAFARRLGGSAARLLGSARVLYSDFAARVFAILFTSPHPHPTPLTAQGWACAPMVMLVLPTACYLKVFWSDLSLLTRITLALLVVFGSVLAVCGTAMQAMAS